jgi:HTH-type transcriptional regulator/antitoxin HigA
MKFLAITEDDFPSSPATAVEPRRYYDAFLKADAILATTPKNYRDTAEHRIGELISHLYSSGGTANELYRKRHDAPQNLANIWLSTVREIAGWFISANATPVFRGLDRRVLSELPRQFKSPTDLPRLSPFLAPLGIVLIWESGLPSLKLDGAVFSVPTGHIVVALSLRYPRLDNFWFTLLHELAHVVLHADQLTTPILDDLDAPPDDLTEKQADRLAADSLIPRNEWRSCPAKYTNSTKDVVQFANRLGIPAQCVAGRLQRELARYDLFSELVNQYNVRELLNGEKA